MAFGGRMIRISGLNVAAGEKLRIGGFREDDLRFWPLATQDAGPARNGDARPIAGDPGVEPMNVKVGKELASRRILVDKGVGGAFAMERGKPARQSGRAAGWERG